MHTGTHADETPARPLGLPMNLVAANLSNLLEDDLHAVYAWARNLLPTTGAAADQDRQTYARLCAADADCLSGETCYAATHECVGGPCVSDADERHAFRA